MIDTTQSIPFNNNTIKIGQCTCFVDDTIKVAQSAPFNNNLIEMTQSLLNYFFGVGS